MDTPIILSRVADALIFLSGAAGGGVVATLIFQILRRFIPQPQVDATDTHSGWMGVVVWLLWAPLGARISVMGMSIVIVALFSMLRAAVGGADIVAETLAAVDTAVAAAGISQIIHAPQLSRAVTMLYDDLPADPPATNGPTTTR